MPSPRCQRAMPSPRCQRVHDANVIKGGVLLHQGILEIRIQFNVRVTLVADPGNRHATVSRVPKFAEFLNILECNPSEDKNSVSATRRQKPLLPLSQEEALANYSLCPGLVSSSSSSLSSYFIIMNLIIIMMIIIKHNHHDDHHHCKGLKAFWCHCLCRE